MPRPFLRIRVALQTLSLSLGLLLGACAGPTQVITTDFTQVSGVYLIAYVDRADIRERLELQFVEDLEARGIRAVASAPDLPDIKAARPRDMVRAANGHSVAAIIIVNRVAADGSGSIIEAEERVRPADLPAYYEITSSEVDRYTDGEPIFAEANGFLVDGNRTRRFWTGTTWTLAGDDDAVIGNVSATIADELDRAGREFRDYSRPIQ
ncbi:MAG: hypothetical protein AAGE43_07085 [Pseudomonadota bacterium]